MKIGNTYNKLDDITSVILSTFLDTVRIHMEKLH